jgi:hypothetical protein
MLAKVCSDKNKPNGQYQILPSRSAVMDFIKDLPIRKVKSCRKAIICVYIPNSTEELESQRFSTPLGVTEQIACISHIYES